jgi:hypothetical protein
MSKDNFAEVWAEASAAFQAAYQEVNPPKFVVGSSVGLSDEIDYSQPVYEMVGLCGFAWVNLYVDGRSPFAKWLKKNDYASKGYYGGYQVWSSRFGGDFGQSVERKEAGCEAAAKVFQKYGYQAYAGSRLD